jgi:2-keto-4-pentenoate hydratase/2-oxohepta-3-ene-1,7-dioic acid hydratase in catechol pathway
MIEETRTALGETGVSEHPLGLRPTKILAVHLNYRSRAEERGRMPRHPSYFLKPPSSLAADGAAVIRPQGCELLNCEGELAAVIGARARHVAPEDALAHVAYYSAANDFGLYDMRAADRGSNLFAKGQDGYTPVGPALIAPSDLDEALTLRTYVNGLIVQEDSTSSSRVRRPTRSRSSPAISSRSRSTASGGCATRSSKRPSRSRNLAQCRRSAARPARSRSAPRRRARRR